MALVSLVLHPPLAWIAMLYGGLGALDAVWTAALLVALPGLAVAQALALGGVPADELPRIPVYASSATGIALLGAVSLALGVRRAGWGGAGLSPVGVAEGAGWAAAGLVGAALLTLAAVAVGGMGRRERSLVEALLPVTGREKAAFVGLSLCAGLGEEIAYRGYLVPVLGGWTGGPWSAVALAALPFGLLHAYQGPRGVVRTAALGGLLGVVMVASGSVWPAVAAHAAWDVVAGLWLGERLLAGGRGRP